MALMKKLTSAIVASSLVLGLVGTAGATTPDKVQTAAERMFKLGLVNGVTPGATTPDLALNANLTRAQLVTILVRAFGQESNSKYLNGAASFPDAQNHPWASGYIAMAKRIIAERTGGKEVVGMPDGTFNPDGNVTAAEAVAFLMKFVGAPQDSTLAWPDNYIQGAANAGLITAEDKAVLLGVKNAPATRGLAFYLADRTFYGYKLAEGGTTYTTFVDTVKPVVTVDAVPATTLEDKVIVTGTVPADVVAVHVGSMDNAATIANGKFTATINLKVGDNSILVHAVDLAGNASEQTVKVSRTVGNAASIEAADITVAAGATAEVKAVVKDAKQNEITGVTPTGESTVGTFADGKFTAGTKAGEGKLTLKVGEVTKDVKVTVIAADLAKVGASNVNPAVGEQVNLTAQDQYGNVMSGATFTVDKADALMDSQKGILIASQPGNYVVTATKDGKTATLTVGVYSATVKDLAIVAPKTVVGNSLVGGETTTYGTEYEVSVKAVDANGNTVSNFNDQIAITLPAGFALGKDEAGLSKNAKNGVATFKVIAGDATVGTEVEIGAKANADKSTDKNTELTGSSTATVEVTEQVATSVKFDETATAKFIRANDNSGTTNVSVYLADQNGKRYLAASGYVIKLNITGPATFTQDDATAKETTQVYSGSKISVPVFSVRGLTGDATVTATVEGLGTATVKTTAAIATDAAAVTVKADVAEAVANNQDNATYTVQVVDKNGVPVAGSHALKATFNSDATSEFIIAGVSDTTGVIGTAALEDEKTTVTVTTNAEGQAKFTVSAHKFVGDLKVDITDTAKNLTAASTSVKFVADSPQFIKMTRDSAVKVAGVSPKATIKAQVTDAAGNKTAVAGLKVTFTGYEMHVVNGDTLEKVSTSTSGDVSFNGTAKKLEVTTDATGTASVDVSVLGYVGKIYGIEVAGLKADGTDLKGNVVDPTVPSYANDGIAIYVDNSVATTLTTTIYKVDDAGVTGPAAVSSAAGAPIKVTVSAKDAAGKKVEYDTIKLIPSGTAYVWDNSTHAIAKDSTSADIKISKDSGYTMVYNATDMVYELYVLPQTAGTFTFTLKDTTSGAEVTSTRTLRVTPAIAAKFVVNAGDALTIKKNTASGAITIKLADEFNNGVTAATKVYAAVTAVTADAAATDVNPGVRTAVSAPDVRVLSIAAGSNATTFYIYNSLPAGTYTVTFTQVKDAIGTAWDGTTTAFTGTLTFTVEN